MRDLNCEYVSESREYYYNFDDTIRQYMFKTFEPFFTGNDCLEMGCYDGSSTSFLLDTFSEITVVEGSSELIEKAKKKLPPSVNFFHSYFEDFVPSLTYSNIFLIHTLEHLDDPVAVLKRAKTWLKDGGRLFVAVPNAYSLSRQIAAASGIVSHCTAITPGEKDHGHRITFCYDTLLDTVRSSGLSVIDHGGVLLKPFANFQFDKLIEHEIIDQKYIDSLYVLGKKYPDLCASLYCICQK